MKHIAFAKVRLLGYLLDLSVWLIFSILPILWFSASGSIIDIITRFIWIITIYILTHLFIYLPLEAWLISRYGGTPGKLLTGTKTVTSQGHNLTFLMAIFRNNIGYMISGMMFFAGFIWILIDKHRRGWHDQISDTYVIVYRKSGWILGLVSLVILTLVNIWLIRHTYLQFTDHAPLYQELFQSLSEDN